MIVNQSHCSSINSIPYPFISDMQFKAVLILSEILNIFAFADMSRTIKMEEDDYPLSSPELDHAFFNHCLTTFYDHDSEEIIQAKCTAQDVFDILEHSVDLCDTPLADIMRIVQENATFRGVDAELVRRKVIKHKYLLKRMRAKDRKAIAKQRRQVIELAATCDHEDQYKKQRNRISAQISRDKKKEKVKALEEMNHQLEQECQRQRLENEKLREQLQKSHQKTAKDGSLKNRLTKLLILLGIIFLFGLIKDIFNSQSQEAIPLTKMNQLTSNSYVPKNEAPFSEEGETNKAKMLECIEQSLTEVVEHRGLASRIKERIGREMKGWGDWSWGLTSKAKEEIQNIKKQALL